MKIKNLLGIGLAIAAIGFAVPVGADTVGGGRVLAPPPGVFSPLPDSPAFSFTLKANFKSQTFGFVDSLGNWGVLTGPATYSEIRGFPAVPYKAKSEFIGPGLFHNAADNTTRRVMLDVSSLQGVDLFGLSGTTGKFVVIGVFPDGTTNFQSGWIYETYGWVQDHLVVSVP